jgi:hypothetical protein
MNMCVTFLGIIVTSCMSLTILIVYIYVSYVNCINLLETKVEVEVEVEVNLRPTVSRPVRLGIWPPYGTLDQILSCSSFFPADNYLIILPKESSLMRRRVCSLQWNHSLVPITILYCLI